MSVNLNDFINSNSFGGFNLNNLIQPDLLKGYSNGSGDTAVVEYPEKLLEQTLTNRVAGFVPANEVENKSNNNFSPEAQSSLGRAVILKRRVCYNKPVKVLLKALQRHAIYSVPFQIYQKTLIAGLMTLKI